MNKLVIGLVVLGVALIGYGAIMKNKPLASTEALTTFASCLKDSGATFYGAFWCPHCQAQKAMFGKAVDQLPYVECSTPDGQAQTQECQDKEITSYPTWEFADGSRESGELSFELLASKSGCELPTE